MRDWKTRARLLVGDSLLLFAGCIAKGQDQIDVTETLPSTVLVKSPWHLGNGFVIDQHERLLLTSRYIVGAQKDVDILFPLVDNGKAQVKRIAWLDKGPRIKGKVVHEDKLRDVAVIRVDTLPEGVAELKLAKDGVEKDAPIQFLGAAAKPAYLWAATASTVQAVGNKQFVFEDQKINARMLELNAEGKLAREVSGGPVVNASNEVVGMVAGDPAQKGQLMCIDVSDLRPPLATTYRIMATKSFELSNYDKAIAYCDKAMSLYAKDALTFNQRGAAYSMKDQFDKAIADYTEAIKLDANLTVAYRNRGSAYFHTGKLDEAVKDCSKAITLEPKYVRAYEIRHEAYVKLNKTKEAEADAQTLAVLTKRTWKTARITGEPDSAESKR